MNSSKRPFKLSIGIPSSLVSEIPHLREKTSALGQIARAAAVFRVDDVYIFRDAPDESRLIRLVLSYLETPQYLRRRMFKKMEELRYVGILPPLRTPHHPLEKRADRLEVGEFREGVVLSDESGEYAVEIGVDRRALVRGRAPSVGGRATVKITEVSPQLRGVFAGRREIDLYWGYGVHVAGDRLEGLISNKRFDLKIATSRHSPPLKGLESEVRERFSDAKDVLVAFGSPRRGLGEMIPRGSSLDDLFDLSINTLPSQGVETVRTEEAVHATLAILNYITF